jgi:hypothetical protein
MLHKGVVSPFPVTTGARMDHNILIGYIVIAVLLAVFLHNSRVRGIPKLGDRNDNFLLVVCISVCWPIVMVAAILMYLGSKFKRK